MELDLTEATVLEIANFYKTSQESLLRANMVISKDGFFVDADGSSRGLSSPLDLKVLLTLRAISDCVLVGAKTAVSEAYRPPKLSEEYRALNISNPRLAVLSRSLSFDLTTRLFSDYDNRPIIFTQISADEIWLENLRNLKDFADVEVLADPMDLANVVKILNQLNYQKIVCEGGPNLLAQLLALDLVDELDLTQSPVSTGSATKISKSELEATRQISSIISTWPNRITAKLGQHAVSRIKR